MMNHLAYSTYFDKLLELGSKKLFFLKEHDMLLIVIAWLVYLLFFNVFADFASSLDFILKVGLTK